MECDVSYEFFIFGADCFQEFCDNMFLFARNFTGRVLMKLPQLMLIDDC